MLGVREQHSDNSTTGSNDMLVWEEDTKSESRFTPRNDVRSEPAPEAAKVIQQPVRTAPTVEAAVPLPAPPARIEAHIKGHAVAHAETSSRHRVKASDKRIINGRTDVNQLVPFKYKWAWE